MKRLIIFLIVISLFVVKIAAADTNEEIFSQISNDFNALKEALPQEVLDFFPKEIWMGDFSSLLGENLSESSFINVTIDYLFLGLGSVIKTFCSILIVVLLSGIFNMLKNSISSNNLEHSFSLASSLCISITIFTVCTKLTQGITRYMKVLCTIMKAFIPIMGTMYLISGNISSGAVSYASMILFITIVEQLLISFISPIVSISLCFSILKSFGSELDFSDLGKIFKNAFTGITVFIMSIFMFVLSNKNILAQSVDSLSIKTAKFAISSFIPIVGPSINDALRTLVSSISYIKNACGVIAIIIIILLVLPAVLSLLLTKLSFNILASISKGINCKNESAVIEEGSNICGFLIALISCTCILFIFAITLFIKATVINGV